ncbi:hypothetical protein [Streptomyces sp. NRRL S-340]|uniref:hypothetical protein n=1 Tax=Streptomyces sp. NRRL S-340 TaxID=1463901 RepID=UPI00069113A0|nr:hypothetical protein [Streptomyces sp. NRRL S-340]
MGVSRRFRHLPGGRRALAAAGLAVAAAGALAACDPGGLSTATVSYTTDRTATAELNRRHTSVSRLSCTARDGDGGRAHTPGRQQPSASRVTVVTVDCRGRTGDGREITVTGKVTRAVDGVCVRGDLTAKAGGRTVFHVDGLGDCDAATGPGGRPPATREPAHRPSHRQPAPVVTVTVTRTLWCGTDPACGPVRGK